MALQPGLSGAVVLAVSDADTAVALRSGEVPVLATPRVVGLVEEASCAAVAGHLEPGATTVGMRVELTHLLPVPVGESVKAEVTLERVEGRRLVFTASVTSDHGLVAAGKITRVVVDRERFVEKAG